MGKELKPIRMEARTYTKLQKLSSEFKKPLGEVLEGLTFFAKLIQEGRWTNDDKLATLIKGLLKSSMENTGKRVYWEGEKVNELIRQFENLKEFAIEAGDSETAAQAEARIKAIKEEHGLDE